MALLMNNLSSKNELLVGNYKQASRRKKTLAVLGLVVAFMTTYALMLPAITMSKGTLTCGIEEHAHAETCYAEVLVCGQEEAVGHKHNDNCYEDVLACGQEEGEDHAHSSACYESQLACGMDEQEGHAHSADCYEKQLTCDIPEHTHTDACYSHVDTDQDDNNGASTSEASGAVSSASASASGEAAKSDEAASKESAVKSDDAASKDAASTDVAAMPAAEFEEAILDSKGNPVVKVYVKAPEGAFPEGTKMQVKPISTASVQKKVEDAIKDANAEQAANGEKLEIKSLTAVDIVFKDAKGTEIEPAKKVEVKITTDSVRDYDNPALVHVLDKTKESSVGKVDDAEVVEQVEIVNEDERDTTEGTEDTVKFESKAFSPYVIVDYEFVVEPVIVLASDGHNYKISVAYGPEAQIPEGAKLQVAEIVQSDGVSDEPTEYESYLEMTREALGLETSVFEYVRFFDIKIVDEHDEKVTPEAPVDVTIELYDKDAGKSAADSMQVVHFEDGAAQGDVLTDIDANGDTVGFATAGFSVYAIVDGPSVIPEGWSKLTSVDQIIAEGAEKTDGTGGLYIGHTSGYFFMNTTVTDGVGTNKERTGIKKTTPATTIPPLEGDAKATKYYFEPKEGTSNQFYVYCYSGGTKLYVYHGPQDNSLSFAEGEQQKTAFTIDVEDGGKFVVHDGSWYWNMQGGASGSRFCSWSKNNDDGKLYFWDQTSDTAGDPYALNGKPYTLLTWDEGKTGKALTGDLNQDVAGNLCAEFLTVMTKNDPDEGLLQLFVPDNSSEQVTSWTFHWVHDDLYKLEATIYGRDAEGKQILAGTKYLKINSDGSLSMVDAEADASEIQVIPGTGIHEGQIALKSGKKTLTYSGAFEQGFNTNAGTGNEWLYLAKGKLEEELKDYYRTYTATKISVSDPSLSPQSPDDEPKKIIIYTRVWNGSKYEFFAIDGNGYLVPCSESGNEIEWVGAGLNELQWEFTEYGSWTLVPDEQGRQPGEEGYETTYKEIADLQGHQPGEEGYETTYEYNPNKYYELQSAYTGQYLAPLIKANQILSSETIGLNLNGRTNGQYYTPIISWDDDNYSFASIKADFDATGDATIEPCYRADGMDFYFAIINELEPDDTIHTVPTVDNTLYGIEMRLANYNTYRKGTNCDTSKEQFTVLGNEYYDSTGPTQGLLSTNLDDNGYPTVRSNGNSLALLYTDKGSGGQADSVGDVNHLFVESTYQATGYYEYDSTQNYAYLSGGTSGDFTVYQEIGTSDGANKDTLKHGQFLPFSAIEPGDFVTKNNPRNLYTATAEPLSPTDPRYNEQLYRAQRGIYQQTSDKLPVDYFFGMELTASFYQTPSGLDAWGHDIIFEFSGDDDFWLYVDGELVIDLGGIHSAVPGSVNFRTGDVYVSGERTTLRELFRGNYIARGMSEEEADAKCASIFGESGTVFQDNTRHEMKIFYMERGAGASNLHMRFNLASVKKGTMQLTKEVDVNGEDVSDSVHAVFPYQIWYKHPLTGQYVQLVGSQGSVKYLGSTNDVTYKPTLYVDTTNPDGTACSVKYEGVYLVKPGETIEVTFPVFGSVDAPAYVNEYYIVECGVDPEVYTTVKLNDDTNPIEGTQVNTNIRVDERDERGDPTADGIVPIREVYSGLCDYKTNSFLLEKSSESTLEERAKVTYKNCAQETKELLIEKNLYKKEGNADPVLIPKSDYYLPNGDPIDPDNPDLKTTFGFRVSFKTPYDADYTPANVYEYHVKDPGGYYCKWVPAENSSSDNPNEEGSQGHFERIMHGDQGVDDFEELTDDVIVEGQRVRGEKSEATFDTSINGSISQIPAYYTVEICGLIPGTDFKVVERPAETPDGHEFYRYELNDDPQSITDPLDGVKGTVGKQAGSEVLVDNYKGYGLRLYKTWADARTMADRDPVYFAVFYELTRQGGATVVSRDLVEGSVRQLAYSSTNPQELYWFYLQLPGQDEDPDRVRVFNNYVVREVTLAGDFTVDPTTGVVDCTPTTTITVVEDGGVIDNLRGKSNSEGAGWEDKTYRVTYDEAKTVNSTLRRFKVTNTPSDKPAVKFLKVDWPDGTEDHPAPLAGATFTLKQGSTDIFGENGKTSDSNGLISVEHLDQDTSYVLKETAAPQGFYGLQQELTFKLVADASDGWTLDVTPSTGDITNYYDVEFEQVKDEQGKVTAEYVTLTIKNRPYAFKAIKQDSLDGTKLAGVEFELYKKNQGQWESNPMTWDDGSTLTTNASGVIPHLDSQLPVGTYQLREIDALGAYMDLEMPVDITVSPTGAISLGNHPTDVTLSDPTVDPDTGVLTYTLIVPNTPKPIVLAKVDSSTPAKPLNGSTFKLEKWDDEHSVWAPQKLTAEGTWATVPEGETFTPIQPSGDNAQVELANLPVGRYCLTETDAPVGYIMATKCVYFTIASDRSVTLTKVDGSAGNDNANASIKVNTTTGVYVITVKNVPGKPLPTTGGAGTVPYTFGGIALIVTAACMYGFGSRRGRERGLRG